MTSTQRGLSELFPVITVKKQTSTLGSFQVITLDNIILLQMAPSLLVFRYPFPVRLGEAHFYLQPQPWTRKEISIFSVEMCDIREQTQIHMPFGQSEDLLLQIKLTALSLVFTGISELW
jgi:hypothetical protein